jgi:recombination protein RecA
VSVVAGKRESVLDRTVKLLQKRFGETSATRLGTGRQAAGQITEVIPTGIEVVDHYLLAVGGLPVGRMSEVSGVEGCGKTAFALQCMAACQAAGGTALLLDAERSFDEGRARTMGVRVDDLIVLDPQHAEMGIEQTKLVVSEHDPRSGPLLVVWDTVAAMLPDEDRKREAGDRGVGSVPRLMSAELKKLLPMIVQHRAHLLMLNQVRANIGVMFGPTTTTPGGNAPRFYASWRVGFFGGKAIKTASGAHTGKIVTMSVGKTRTSEPFRKARVRFDYATGWNNEWSTLEHAKEVKKAPRGAKGAKAHNLAKEKLWGVQDTPADAPGAEASDESE